MFGRTRKWQASVVGGGGGAGEVGGGKGVRGVRGGGGGGRGGRGGRCGRRVVVEAVVGVERIQWGVIDRTC